MKYIFYNCLSLFFILIFCSIASMEQQSVTAISWKQLNSAIVNNDAKTVQLYLEQRNPDPKKLVRPLHKALDNNAVGPVALLLRYGVPVDQPYHKNGPTPLFKMTQQGNIQMVEWLRIFKARSDIPNRDGHTPLEYACIKELDSEDQETRQKYCEIFYLLYAPFALMQMRQYKVQVPEELR